MDEQVFDTELMGVAVDLTVTSNQTRLERLEVLARLDDSKAYLEDGFTSVTAFLMARCGMGAREAKRELFLARSIGDMAYTYKLAAEGRLSVNQLEVLAYARSRHPEPFSEDEPVLAEAATGLDLADTRRLVDYWTQRYDDTPSGSDRDDPSRLFWSRTWKQRGRLDGDLDPELAALLDAALGPLMDELVNTTPNNDRPPAPEIRAQALAEILRRHLDSDSAPTDHGNRPHITVVVRWETLLGLERDGTCELGDGTIITPETVQRLACDALVSRLILETDSEVLDLGRSKRTVSAAQWRALRVRDRHCQFPGCKRPWSWTDAHHIIAWYLGGETNLDNLVLICRFHHTLVHEGGWKLTGKPGQLVFTRPNGTILTNGPP